MSNFSKTIAVVLLIAWSGQAVGQQHDARTAPWDYRDPRYLPDLGIVNKYHFNRDVQRLTAGQSNDHPGPDLAYIFRFFPNHHPALDVMGRLWRSYSVLNQAPPGLTATQNADYYFEQAIEFSPDDGIVRMLYGNHAYLEGRNDEALTHYEAALELQPDSPDIHYNAGLFFFSVGNNQRAIEHARTAYGFGYPLPGLRNKLKRADLWDDEAAFTTPD